MGPAPTYMCDEYMTHAKNNINIKNSVRTVWYQINERVDKATVCPKKNIVKFRELDVEQWRALTEREKEIRKNKQTNKQKKIKRQNRRQKRQKINTLISSHH